MSTDLDPNAQSPMLVTTDWLAERIDNPDFVLIDAGEAVAYRRVHLPGAVGVPHPYLKGKGSKLVMPPEQFEPLARRWGISNDTPVIIYDDNASLHAARVWWVFRYHGHRNVRVVDGGFNAFGEARRENSDESKRIVNHAALSDGKAARLSRGDAANDAVHGDREKE